jgi:hypothetical protein
LATILRSWENGSDGRGTTPLGGETVENLTQRCTYDVFFQNHHVSRALLRQQLLLD